MGGPLRPPPAGALSGRLPVVLRGGRIAGPPDAGPPRPRAIGRRGGASGARGGRRAGHGRAAGPRRAAPAAGACPVTSGRPSTPSTSQPPRPPWTSSCPTSPCSRQCSATLSCPTSPNSGSAGERHGQRRPGALRQQHHPRAARRAGPGLRERARPPRRPRLPPGELHDLALMVFGIVLNRNGWRIDYLGMNTPVEELVRTVNARRPEPRRPGRDPAGEPRAPRCPAHRARPARSARPGSRRHATDRQRRGGPAAHQRSSHRGREYSVAAVNALAGGTLGFVDTRPCPVPAETCHDVAATTRHPGCYHGASRPSTVTCAAARPPSARLSPPARRTSARRCRPPRR